MRPPLSFQSSARVLLLLLVSVAVPRIASGQPTAPGAPAMAPYMRERLAQAAGDTLLPRWQRDYMLRLARAGEESAHDPDAADARVARTELTSTGGEGAWTELLVSPRDGHDAIYDPVRERMVVFGGWDGAGAYRNDVWTLSLAGPPRWTPLTPAGTAPSARMGHSVIYDPVRDRMVVFGGRGDPGTSFDDVWVLSLAGAPAWTALIPTGTPPAARSGHSAVYDPVHDRMVVFGGWSDTSLFDDAWTLSLAGAPTWTLMTPTGTSPGGRSWHSAIFDPVRERMVVFGGIGGGFGYDVWALSLGDTETWTELTPALTPLGGRHAHSAIYDPVGDRMVVFSGSGGYNPEDLWALSLAGTPAWTDLTPAGVSPSGRYGHSAVYDPVRGRMVIFGGCDGYSSLDDAWELSLVGTPAWASLMPANPPPPGRSGHTTIHDPVRDRMVVFGGSNALGHLDEVWVLSLAGTPTWSALTPTGTPPAARSDHSAIYDPVRNRMVVFGGYGDVYLNDVWVLSLADPPAWTMLLPTGTPPGTRAWHSAVYDPIRDRMVVFGGHGAGYLSDVWALSLGNPPAWLALAPTGTPPSARLGHRAIYDPVRDRMVVFGGSEVSGDYVDDVWALSLAGTPAWAGLTPTGTPPGARWGHSAIYDPARDRMLVFGGSGPRNDVWALSLAGTPSWQAQTPDGSPPSARSGHSAIYDPARDRMVMFGGIDYEGPTYFADAWALRSPGVLGVEGPETPPSIDRLRPPAPNPTRGTTVLSYSLTHAGRVRLGVYDLSGRLLRTLVDAEGHAGAATVTWDGTNESGARLGTGMYFIRLVGPGTRLTRRVALLR